MNTNTLLAVLVATFAIGGCKKDKSESDNKAPAPVGSGSAAVTAEPAKPAAAFATPEAKLKRYTECWDAFNAGKQDVYKSCFAADAVREQVDSIPETTAQGAENIVATAMAQRAAFPDLKVTPQLILVSGGDILAVLHVGGTNTGEAGGTRPTGKKLGIFEANHVVMNDEGVITQDRLFVDQPMMFHQLGLLPNESSPSALEPTVATPETLISKNTPAEAENKKIVEKDLEAVGKKDAKAIEPIVADDVKLTYHGDKTKYDGKKAYMKWLADLLASSKVGFVDVKGIWAAGDYVIVYDVFSGTPAGKDFEDKKIETNVLQVFKLEGGKLKQQHIFANRLKTAVQLGMVDPDALMQQLTKPAK